MVWINRILEATEEGGLCEVVIDRDALYFSKAGLRQSSLVEWMAQGFGYAVAAHEQRQSSKAYLAALKDVEYCDEATWTQVTNRLTTGSKLMVLVKIVRVLGPITMVKGEVKTPEGQTLASAQFKVFITP